MNESLMIRACEFPRPLSESTSIVDGPPPGKFPIKLPDSYSILGYMTLNNRSDGLKNSVCVFFDHKSTPESVVSNLSIQLAGADSGEFTPRHEKLIGREIFTSYIINGSKSYRVFAMVDQQGGAIETADLTRIPEAHKSSKESQPILLSPEGFRILNSRSRRIGPSYIENAVMNIYGSLQNTYDQFGHQLIQQEWVEEYSSREDSMIIGVWTSRYNQRVMLKIDAFSHGSAHVMLVLI